MCNATATVMISKRFFVVVFALAALSALQSVRTDCRFSPQDGTPALQGHPSDGQEVHRTADPPPHARAHPVHGLRLKLRDVCGRMERRLQKVDRFSYPLNKGVERLFWGGTKATPVVYLGENDRQR